MSRKCSKCKTDNWDSVLVCLTCDSRAAVALEKVQELAKAYEEDPTRPPHTDSMHALLEAIEATETE